MHIAASHGPLSPTLASDDAVSIAARAAPDGAVAAASPDIGADGFGGMLSLHLAATVDGTDLPAIVRADADPISGRATNRALPSRVDVKTLPLVTNVTPPPADPSSIVAEVVGAAAAPAAGPTKDSKTDDADTDTDTDRVGTDLAAQLALVAQWAGIAPHPQPATAASSADDIAGKLDTVRGVAAKAADPVDPTAVVRAQAPSDVEAAALPIVVGAALQTTGRDARPSAVAAIASSSKDAPRRDDVRAATDAVPAALDNVLASDGFATSIEKLFAFAGTTGHAVTADNTTVVNAFVTQIAAQTANPQSAATPAASAPTSIVLHEPVGSAAWSHEVGQATLRMATNDMQNVSLHLNPEHLGPLDVRMRVEDGVAHLQFSAAHADTRQALESSRTTLDQMFGQQGIKLGDWSVGQQSSARDFGAAHSQRNGGERADTRDAQADDDTATVVATVRTPTAIGLVDTFA